jgi:hypothetical protein
VYVSEVHGENVDPGGPSRRRVVGGPRALMALLFAVAVAIGLVALYVSARAAITVCVLDVVAGQVFVRRGGLAPRIRADIEDVMARPKIERATLRIVRDRGRAVLEVKGVVSGAQRQQLRNVVGSVPLANLVNARGRR